MFRFFKELYLTAFSLLNKLPTRRGNEFGRIGGAIGAITVIEWFNLVNISACIEMMVGKRLLYFSKPVVIIAFFALFLVNVYALYIRGHGIKFEHEFDNLKKSRKILLVTSCAVLLLATIVFSIYSSLAHRHFISTHA
jgi:hypothetical protein